jgi:hypothetical protein
MSGTCIPGNLQEYTGSDATTIIQTPAFSLQGAATGHLFPMTGFAKYMLKPGVSNPVAGNVSNYVTVPFSTENILAGPQYISSTTLLHNGVQFTLSFIAIHSNVWGSGIQVSMVFTNGLEVFHIAIPIQFDSTFSTNVENTFLKWWLYQNPEGQKPSSFSVNDLLVFNGVKTNATFDFYNFCVSYNTTVQPIHSYYFCNFTTPLYINSGQLPQWLANDLGMRNVDSNGISTDEPRRLKSFNAIFNAMFHGTVFFNGVSDVNLMSSRAFFTSPGNPTGVKPSRFSVNVSILAYKAPTKQSERQLQNIKCYPIDLVSQVDDNGNIYIDESTKKPLDVSSLTSSSRPNLPNADQTAFQNKVIYWTIFTIVLLLALAIIIAFVTWMYTTKNTGLPPGMEIPTVAGKASLPTVGQALPTVAGKASLPLRAPLVTAPPPPPPAGP